MSTEPRLRNPVVKSKQKEKKKQMILPLPTATQ